MSFPRFLKLSLIGLFGLAVAACHPVQVRDSYHEVHVAPVYGSAYVGAPVFVERRTLIVPRVSVAPPGRPGGRPGWHEHRRWEHDRQRGDRPRHGDADGPVRRFGR